MICWVKTLLEHLPSLIALVTRSMVQCTRRSDGLVLHDSCPPPAQQHGSHPHHGSHTPDPGLVRTILT
jgi:hypothetical protein